MINLFKISDLKLIKNHSNQEIFRFVPNHSIKERFVDRELLRRFFSEDVFVNQEPEYPDIIQTLIDANAKNDADICRILRHYPYQANSEIFDYQYLNWLKLGNGTISRSDDTYTFSKAGVYHNNISSTIQSDGLTIEFTMKAITDVNKPILSLYNSIINTSASSPTYFPVYNLNYRAATSSANSRLLIQKRTVNNGTVTNSTNYLSTNLYPDRFYDFRLVIENDGYITLNFFNTKNQSWYTMEQISNSAKFNPQHLRIACSNSTATISTDIAFAKFKIKQGSNIISQWHF